MASCPCWPPALPFFHELTSRTLSASTFCRTYARQCLITCGLMPFLAAPFPHPCAHTSTLVVCRNYARQCLNSQPHALPGCAVPLPCAHTFHTLTLCVHILRRNYARQCLITRGLMPFLAAPFPDGDALLEDGLVAASRMGLVRWAVGAVAAHRTGVPVYCEVLAVPVVGVLQTVNRRCSAHRPREKGGRSSSSSSSINGSRCCLRRPFLTCWHPLLTFKPYHCEQIKAHDHVVVVQRVHEDFCVKIVGVDETGKRIRRM